MENKKLGYVMVGVSIILLILLVVMQDTINRVYDSQIAFYIEKGEPCPMNATVCPYALKARATLPIYVGYAIVFGVFAFGIYLIFFSKSEKAVVEALKETKKKEGAEERWKILLSALSEDEKKIMNAVKEQDGISQSTLRLRTDLSKTKLSILLNELERKNLVKKVAKGKINLVYLKPAV